MAEKTKTKTLDSFIPDSLLGIGTGLKTSANVLAGFEYSRVGKFNASQIQREINELGLTTELNAAQFTRQATQLVGKQKTAIASTGFAFSGSLVDLMTDTLTQIELKRLDTARVAAQKQAALRAQQQETLRAARARRTGAFIQAGATLAKGLGTYAYGDTKSSLLKSLLG